MPASVTAVIPTYNGAVRLDRLLASMRAQDYEGELEILCVDGGSADNTREVASRWGAAVIENPERIQEEGLAHGVEHATGELILLLDDDDELPHAGWLSRMVRCMDLAADVVAADALFHTWRRQDPAINRLSALIGGTDPLAIELGWADRWAVHLGRWTGMPFEQEDVGEALIVRVDPRRVPPMGSNGFLVYRDALLSVDYRPFIHPDIVAQLAARGWRFARVRDSVIHHFAAGTREAMGKIRRRAERTMRELNLREFTPKPPLWRRGALMLWSLTLVGPSAYAARGFYRHRDPAWALYPLLHVWWTLCYALEAARARVATGPMSGTGT